MSQQLYWQNLDQWAQNPEFQKLVETEFRSSPLREEELKAADKDGGWARREFLKLMGASLAMASTACVRRPVEKIVPFNKAVEEITFGQAQAYTSTYFDGQEAFGLIVKTREGRPIKVEGNPAHPFNKGALSARAQAHILSLYDPDRLAAPKKNLPNKERSNFDSVSTTWDAADAEILKQLNKGNVAVLTGNVASPSTRALLSEFTNAFKAQHTVWEPLAPADVQQGQSLSYGEEVVPFYRFQQAKVIVSVDADFLGTWIAPTTFSRQFSQGRKNISEMNKLIAFDSQFSLTGANADVRVRIKPSQQLDVVMGLAHEIIVKKNLSQFAGNATVKAALMPFAQAASALLLEPALFSKIADDLWAHKGKSLVVAGGLATQTEFSRELQIAVNFLNSALENDGQTIDANRDWKALKGSRDSIWDLIQKMQQGQVKTLIIHNTNPGYALAGSAFQEALRKVEMVISTADRMNETAVMANFVLPDDHQMEAWGDTEFADGVISLQQPTIRPLLQTRSFQASLMSWMKLGKVPSQKLAACETFYDYVRLHWKNEVYAKNSRGLSFEDFWDEALQNGVVGAASFDGANNNVASKTSAPRKFKLEALARVKPVPSSGLELVLYPTVALGDGTLANVSWLQELPDPVSKICWDNYASLSLATAEKMKLKEGSLVKVKVEARSLTLPVHIQPGLHDDVLAIAIGYGRTKAGKVANNVGVNAFQLGKVDKNGAVYSGQSLTVEKLSGHYPLACVAGNDSMEGRKIVVEATLQEYLKNPAANNHRHHVFSLWSGHQYNGHKWGMAVDLNSCTGCSACMVACQSENNIAVVGKKYVLQGRIMSWIRIDRYFVGEPKNPDTVFQPVMCQHCDNAPCETVCPVLATVHSSEGLNDMVYNRCVGTRYCSNNCPYKVRRFNWFNFTKTVEKPLHLAYNPDVTVRPRGVMEKCTFCVHRIKSAKAQAKLEQREIKDGEIKTACEQSCPTSAITFGDLNNKQSRVAKLFEEKRAYALLEEFNAAPVVRYMTKIKNNYQESRGSDSQHKGGHA